MRVAAAQTSSVWLDKSACTAKICAWLERAAETDVDLVVFGETFLPGYPLWVDLPGAAEFFENAQREAYSWYLDAAVEADGPELAQIAEACADLGVFAYVGVAERGPGPASGTVYCSLVALDPTQGIVNVHRKLAPTFGERLVWGRGDGHGLRTLRLENGWRVGGLNCWENWMPQARHAIAADGADLHVAVWPGSVRNTVDITRFVAMESRCYVVSAGTLIDLADIPADFPLYEQIAAAVPLGFNGGSCIAAPDGTWLVEPVAGAEKLVVADLDLSVVRQSRQQFDPTGHYGRADVFDVTVDRRRQESAKFIDE